MHNSTPLDTVETLKQELAAVELEQRFEMVQASAQDLVEITNFICSPNQE